MNRIKVVGVIALLALGLVGCSATQQNQIIAGVNTGLNVFRGVACVIGGAGGNFAQRVESRVRANQAWVGTTGDIVAISSDVCLAIGGTPGAPQSVITK